MTIRLDTMSFTFDGQTALFDYAYDLAGRQTQSALTLNNVADRTINIEYDYLGRALSSELTGNALNDILAEFDYNAVGALTDVRRFEWDNTDELYNLIAQSQYQYNARNQITSINHQDSNNNNIVSHGYLYNADGNISQYTNSLDGFVNYDYDFLGQLIGADYSNLNIPDESYQYDLNGNRELVTNANGDLVVYSTGTNNELTSDGAYTYAYDAEGNRISKTNAAGTERELYVWDYRNRLSSVTKQEYNATTQEWQTVQIVEYAYDYNNVLIRKVLDADGNGISDSKTIFLPENYQTAIQLDDADLSDSTYETVSHRYLWTPGQQDKLLADVTPTETLWTLTDHLGTIRDVLKNTPSGLVVPAHVIYDAYGNVLSCKDPNGTDIESPVLFGFTGKYFDADTQLQNNVNRWYDAATGRWLSTDPIGFNGNDTNLYRYVGNGLKTDSFGLDKNGGMGLNVDYDLSQLEFPQSILYREFQKFASINLLTSQLEEWNKNPDYKFAARLLSEFLSNNGSKYTQDNPLDLSNEKYVIDTIRKNNTYQTTIKNKVFTELKEQLSQGSINYSKETKFEIRFNPIATVPFKAVYDGPLGMALGRAEYSFSISDIKFKPLKSTKRLYTCYNYEEMHVKVRVTYTDTYSFVGSGLYEDISRMYNVYYAGYLLERYHGFSSVSSKATWEGTFIFNYTSYKDSNNNSHYYKLTQ